MDYTPNLNLKKPAKTDPVLIDDLNENADIIDQKLKELGDEAKTHMDAAAPHSGHETSAGAQAKAEAAEAAAKAYTDAHAGRTDNPHEVTPEQIGAVPITGGTMTGSLRMADPTYGSLSHIQQVDGDLWLTVNAYWDGTHWQRIDTTTTAWAWQLQKANLIPGEINTRGVILWHCRPGDNPIGPFTAMGGWETAMIFTEHSNLVIGGMNFEIDGSGATYYGRVNHIDAQGTFLTTNAYYDGTVWERDDLTKPAVGLCLRPDRSITLLYAGPGDNLIDWNESPILVFNGFKVGPKIKLYGDVYGIGIQASELTLWVDTGARIAVRQAAPDGQILGYLNPILYATEEPTDAAPDGSMRVVNLSGEHYLYVRSGGVWRRVLLSTPE